MKNQKKSTNGGCLKKALYGFLIFIAAILIIFALSNLLLSSSSDSIVKLSELDKARVCEVCNLRHELGDSIWTGWSTVGIPVIIYNEGYAFIIGLQNPVSGWRTIPGNISQGNNWEVMPNDLIDGKQYYRQKLSADGTTPQAFTVRVGNNWVASMTSKDWTVIKMGNDIRDGLPPIVKIFVPYRLIALAFEGLTISTDAYICLIEHESFHAFQGIIDSSRLIMSEELFREFGKNYPWNDPTQIKIWDEELNTLADALGAKDETRLLELSKKFLSIRERRRRVGNFDTTLINLEKNREWEEGLAKYTELAIWKFAANDSVYKFNKDLNDDSNFNGYKNFKSQWYQEISTLRYQAHGDETRFYYSGMAQAFLLDRLSPKWRLKIVVNGSFLEDLLRCFVENYYSRN